MIENKEVTMMAMTQEEYESLMMTHDNLQRELADIKRLMGKDKHALIKSNISLNKKVRVLEERVRIFEMKYENTGSIMNRSHQIDRIKKIEQQNKRYREAVKEAIQFVAPGSVIYNTLNKALEGEE